MRPLSPLAKWAGARPRWTHRMPISPTNPVFCTLGFGSRVTRWLIEGEVARSFKANILRSEIPSNDWYVQWKTIFRRTVSIPPLLGQPHQIQPYAPPRADERLQIIIADDDESDYMHVVAISVDHRQTLIFKMITSDRRRNSQNYFTQKNLRF